MEWNVAKEKELAGWLRTHENAKLDYQALQAKFPGVPLVFLKQQIFWIYQSRLEKSRPKVNKPKPVIEHKDYNYNKLFKSQYNTEPLKEAGYKKSPERKVAISSLAISDSELSDSKSEGSLAHNLNEVTTHLHSSKIFSSRPPRIDDEDEDEPQVTTSNKYSDILEEPEDPEDTSIKNPLFDHIKYIANKYK